VSNIAWANPDISTPKSTLARWTATRDPDVDVSMRAKMFRESSFVWFIDPKSHPRYCSLLKERDTQAILLPTKIYIVRAEIMNNDFALVDAIKKAPSLNGNTFLKTQTSNRDSHYINTQIPGVENELGDPLSISATNKLLLNAATGTFGFNKVFHHDGVDDEPFAQDNKQRKGKNSGIRPEFFLKPEDFILYYKKKGEVVDKERKNSIWMNLPSEFRSFFLVTPARNQTEGLLILTKNNEFNNYVKANKPLACENYEVVVKGEVEERDLESIRNGILAKVEKSRGGKLIVKKIQPTEIHVLEKTKEQTRLKLSFAARAEREIAAIFRKFDYPIISITRVQIDGITLSNLLPGRYRRFRWDEILVVAQAYLGESLYTKTALGVAQKHAQEEAEDYKVIESILNDPNVLEDAFRNIFKRNELKVADVEREDVHYHKEGGFKRVYRVVVRIKNNDEKFSFFVKVVKPDVASTDSGYLYDEAYAKNILRIAKEMREKDLDLFPAFGGYYIFSDGNDIKRIIFTESIVSATNSQLSDSQRSKIAIKTYLMYYHVSSGKIFFHDPKPENVIIHRKSKSDYRGTIIDVDNVLYDGVGACDVVYNLILHGYKPSDIIDSVVEVFGNKKASKFLQSAMFMATHAYSHAMGGFIEEFRARKEKIKNVVVEPALIKDSIRVKINGMGSSIPEKTTLLEILTDCHANLQTMMVRVNGEARWEQDEAIPTYRKKISRYQRKVLSDGDEITFGFESTKEGKDSPEKMGKATLKIPNKRSRLKLLQRERFDQEIKHIADDLITFKGLLTPALISDDDTIKTRSFNHIFGTLVSAIRFYLKAHGTFPFGRVEFAIVLKRFERIGFNNLQVRDKIQTKLKKILSRMQAARDRFDEVLAMPADELENTLSEGAGMIPVIRHVLKNRVALHHQARIEQTLFWALNIGLVSIIGAAPASIATWSTFFIIHFFKTKNMPNPPPPSRIAVITIINVLPWVFLSQYGTLSAIFSSFAAITVFFGGFLVTTKLHTDLNFHYLKNPQTHESPAAKTELTFRSRKLANDEIKAMPNKLGIETGLAPIKTIKPPINKMNKMVFLIALKKVFDKVGDEVKNSRLNSALSRLNGITQRNLKNASKLRLCIPIEVFKNSADIVLAMNKLSNLRGSIPFELVITGVTKEDVKAVDNFNRKDIKKVLNLPKNLTVAMITEDEIRERANLYNIDLKNLKNRVGIIKELYLEMLNAQVLPEDECMAIAVKTDVLTREDAEKLAEEKHLKNELEDNISIRILISPDSDPKKRDSLFSLSAIIDEWLEDIRKGNKSAIGVTFPIPVSLVKKLENAIKEAWIILASA